jgi:hypothetical protein
VNSILKEGIVVNRFGGAVAVGAALSVVLLFTSLAVAQGRASATVPDALILAGPGSPSR